MFKTAKKRHLIIWGTGSYHLWLISWLFFHNFLLFLFISWWDRNLIITLTEITWDRLEYKTATGEISSKAAGLQNSLSGKHDIQKSTGYPSKSRFSSVVHYPKLTNCWQVIQASHFIRGKLFCIPIHPKQFSSPVVECQSEPKITRNNHKISQ